MRLVVDDKKETIALKKIRNNVSNILKNSKIKQSEIIKHRDSCSDIGKTIKIKNSKKAIMDIFIANAQRVKEAIRVIEEVFCILDKKTSNKLQNLRFKFYSTEKESTGRLINYLSQK